MLSKRTIYLLFPIAVVIFCNVSCKKDNQAAPHNTIIHDKDYYGRQTFVIGLNGNYDRYDSALKRFGLADTLAGTGPFTTFLMDNNAVPWGFDAPSNAGSIFRSFILRGNHPLKSLPVGRNQAFETLTGNHIYIGKYPIAGDSMLYTLNGVRIVSVDFPSTNGPIEVIDSLIPCVEANSSVLSYVNSNSQLTFLALALKRTGLDKLLDAAGSSWTLLAPYDGAFRNSPDTTINSFDHILQADTAKLSRILRYHILPDRNFLVDFLYQRQGADTLHVNTLLGGPTLSVFFMGPNWWSGFGYYFTGPGNRTTDANGNPVITTVNLYQPTYPYSIADQVTGNGVIHEVDNILIP